MKPAPMILLRCPECSGQNGFPLTALVAGGTLTCPHCGAELLISHDRDTPDGPPVWRLESPAPADEPRSGM